MDSGNLITEEMLASCKGDTGPLRAMLVERNRRIAELERELLEEKTKNQTLESEIRRSEAERGDALWRLGEIAELVEDYVDIDDNGGPNLGMKIKNILSQPSGACLEEGGAGKACS